MSKRIFDLFFSLTGLLILLPVFLLVALLIKIESKGPVFYLQMRVGRNGKDFKLFKFRTMFPDSDKKGLLTVGMRDPRITSTGYFLRKYKLDELPQLINVLTGEMSFVGPRPEVRKYVDKYSNEELAVLEVKPGITDLASLTYINENAILAQSSDPENTYIKEVMPHKLALNMEYIRRTSLWFDIKIIFQTIIKIFK
ncbi:MAG: sugar transferase [Bacteroidia bacterium]|nr:sugar transferase [Bacteroidia bacterium]